MSILVFKNPPEEVEVSKNDLLNYFDELTKEAAIEQFHFEKFYEWEISQEKPIDTNITSIVLQDLIMKGAIPILKFIPDSRKKSGIIRNVKKESLKTLKSMSAAKMTRTPQKPEPESAATQSRDTTAVQVPHNIFALYGGKLITVAANTFFYVVGILLRDCFFIKTRDPRQVFLDRVKSGKYGVDLFMYQNVSFERSNSTHKITQLELNKVAEYVHSLDFSPYYSVLYRWFRTAAAVPPIIPTAYIPDTTLSDYSLSVFKLFIVANIDKKWCSDAYIYGLIQERHLLRQFLLIENLSKTDPLVKDIIEATAAYNKNVIAVREQRAAADYAAFVVSVKNRYALLYYKKPFTKLRDLEKQAVEQEFDAQYGSGNIEAQKATAEQIVAYKLVRELNQEVINVAKLSEILRELRKYVSRSTHQHEYIKYKNKNLICSHWIDLADIMIKSKNQYADIKRLIADYRYNGDLEKEVIHIDSSTICKVCGAMLANTETGDSLDILHAQHYEAVKADETTFEISREAYSIISMFVYFRKPVEVRDIVAGIIDILYPRIKGITAEIHRIKTQTSINDYLVNLNIAIYIFAYVSHLIFLDGENVTFVTTIKRRSVLPAGQVQGGKQDTTNDTRLINIINAAFSIIKSTKSIVIQKLGNVANDSYIRATLVKAYQYISNAELQIRSDKKALNAMDLRNFIKNDQIYRVFEYAHRIKGSKATESTVLNKTVDAILKTRDTLYDKVKNPFGDKGHLSDDIFIQLSNWLIEYITLGIYRFPGAPKTEEEMEFDKKTEKLSVVLENYKTRRALDNAVPTFHSLRSITTPGIYNLYCDDSQTQTHNFIPIASKDGKVRDRQCSNCKKLFSKTTLNTPLVKSKSRKELDRRMSAFDYFTHTCPVGKIHEPQTDKCKKCGFLFDHPDQDAFFKKYAKAFETRKSDVADEINATFASIFKPNKPHLKYIQLKAVKVNEKVMELSKIVGVKHNILFNLGLFEGKKTELIETDKASFFVDATDDILSSRRTYLGSYLLNITTIVSKLKNFERVAISSKLPADLIEAVKGAGTLQQLGKKLDIVELPDANILDAIANTNNKEACMHLLYHICDILINCNKALKNSALSGYFINAIVGYEKRGGLYEKSITSIMKQKYLIVHALDDNEVEDNKANIDEEQDSKVMDGDDEKLEKSVEDSNAEYFDVKANIDAENADDDNYENYGED
jgi:hypothetical protein